MTDAKGLAARTVVLLVLAIIVLAVSVYLVYTQFMGGGQAIDYNRCVTHLKNRCSECCMIGINDEKMCSDDENALLRYCNSTTSPIDVRDGIPCASLGTPLAKCSSVVGGYP